MVDVRTEITIACKPDQTAAFSADPDNAPIWYKNIKDVEWQTPKPLKIGSKITFEAHFLGRRLIYLYEVTSFKPGIELTMQTAEGPFPMKTIYTWESIGSNHTLMTLRNVGQPSGFSLFVKPL